MDEDEELHSTNSDSKEKCKDKKVLCKVKWSRDEVRVHQRHMWSGNKCVIHMSEESPYQLLI